MLFGSESVSALAAGVPSWKDTLTIAGRSRRPTPEAFPELHQHCTIWNLLIWLPHDRFMQLRVEDCAYSINCIYSQAFHDINHLLVSPCNHHQQGDAMVIRALSRCTSHHAAAASARVGLDGCGQLMTHSG